MQDTVKRRLDLLNMEGMGFSRPEIVKKLAVDHKCSDRTVYYDFKSRGRWQPILQIIEDQQHTLMKTVNCLEQLYRKASVKYLSASNESVQLGCLRLMADIRLKIQELLYPRNVKTEMTLTQEKPFVIEMWRPKLAAPDQ